MDMSRFSVLCMCHLVPDRCCLGFEQIRGRVVMVQVARGSTGACFVAGRGGEAVMLPGVEPPSGINV